MLRTIRTTNTGPADTLEVTFGSRLSVLTGDNGVGKSFILDLAWFLTTGSWPSEVNSGVLGAGAARARTTRKAASLSARFVSGTLTADNSALRGIDLRSWQLLRGSDMPEPIAAYALSDATVAWWDGSRHNTGAGKYLKLLAHDALVLRDSEVFFGHTDDKGTLLSPGLLADWVSWQRANSPEYLVLCDVLRTLSEGMGEPIVPVGSTRLRPDDAREIPTIRVGTAEEIPITIASSAVRRILSLAWLVVSGLSERKRNEDVFGFPPVEQFLILIDEIELHLHPRWQRVIVGSLLTAVEEGVRRLLGPDAKVDAQMILTTHSPVVLASLNGLFDPQTDVVLELDIENSEFKVTERHDVRLGNSDMWLRSATFDLTSTRSPAEETVLKEAAELASNPRATRRAILDVDRRLAQLLAEFDPEWVRWSRFRDSRLGSRESAE